MRKKPIQEERFYYKGFPCVVLFQYMGFRTGYVGIPKGHKYYGKDYSLLDISCHCGLTYSDNNLANQNDKDIWWIGFDCGHCCDGFDLVKLEEYYGTDETIELMRPYHLMINAEHEFKTLEYVKEQCMYIVRQLVESEE